jgi:2-phosphosulfolactate phosphatase
MNFDQGEFQVRCGWGWLGVRELRAISDVIVIVDVLSFSTAVDIATARGGVVFPFPYRGEPAVSYAALMEAQPASEERGSGFSLSPASLRELPAGYRLVLPSPNGAALSFSMEHPIVLAGCLRNATAVGQAASRLGSTVAVIAAGEVGAGGEFRTCIEDWIGVGAVIDACTGLRSTEASVATGSFHFFREGLKDTLRDSPSGKELIERGCGVDVDLAAEVNVSSNVPWLVDRAFVSATVSP